jgi:hypothetical protein
VDPRQRALRRGPLTLRATTASPLTPPGPGTAPAGSPATCASDCGASTSTAGPTPTTSLTSTICSIPTRRSPPSPRQRRRWRNGTTAVRSEPAPGLPAPPPAGDRDGARPAPGSAARPDPVRPRRPGLARPGAPAHLSCHGARSTRKLGRFLTAGTNSTPSSHRPRRQFRRRRRSGCACLG